MAMVPAICTQCGGKILVDDTHDAGICQFCGTPFITEKAIIKYQNTFNVENATINVTGVNVENLLRRAKEFENNIDFDRAIEYYDKVLDEDSNMPEAKEGLIRTTYKRDGNKYFHRAVKYGNSEIVNGLLKLGVNVNVPDDDGFPPLILAMRSNNNEIVKALLKAGADTNVRDEEGFPPLIKAIRSGNNEIVDALLKAGADLNIRDNNGHTPLIEAIRTGNNTLAELLIKAGANVNVRDNSGYTPLIEAIRAKHNKVVETLIKAGADVNVKNENADLQSLLSSGSLQSASATSLQNAATMINNIGGWSALIIAAKSNNVAAVELLIQAGADVDAHPNNGETALIAAARRGFTEIVSILIAADADLDIRDIPGGYKTATMWAAKEGYSEIIEMLQKAGADINAVDVKNHNTLWHLKHSDSQISEIEKQRIINLLKPKGLLGSIFG